MAYAGMSDPGSERSRNEDVFLLRPDRDYCLVADGMGGHKSGVVASKMAAQEISRFYDNHAGGEGAEVTPADRWIGAIRYANERIFDAAAKSTELKGMGTTVVGMSFHGRKALVAHVGDSRCYRLRGDEFEQITEDHSMVNEYLRNGLITPEEAERFPYRHVITRAVGVSALVQVETHTYDILPGDLYLLCSDGLSDMVPDPMLKRIVEDGRDDLEAACKTLVDTANARGGKDNITVVLASVAP